MKKLAYVPSMAAAVGIGYCLSLFAQGPGPVVNINMNRHPDLASAQMSVVQAYQAMTRAQQTNQYELGGHAGHAKDLLVQADYEMRQAANSSNRNGH